jgi:hypothetical protein
MMGAAVITAASMIQPGWGVWLALALWAGAAALAARLSRDDPGLGIAAVVVSVAGFVFCALQGPAIVLGLITVAGLWTSIHGLFLPGRGRRLYSRRFIALAHPGAGPAGMPGPALAHLLDDLDEALDAGGARPGQARLHLHTRSEGERLVLEAGVYERGTGSKLAVYRVAGPFGNVEDLTRRLARGLLFELTPADNPHTDGAPDGGDADDAGATV